MNYNVKLVAVDVDGTFVRSDYTYDVPRFRRILERMKKADCNFVVASGNQYAGGQGQSIAELNQTVIVIIDGILYELCHKCLVLIRHIENTDGCFNVRNHKRMGDTDLRSFFPPPLHAVAVAIDQMTLGADTCVSANIVKNAIYVSIVHIQMRTTACNILAGQCHIPGMVGPRTGIGFVRLLQRPFRNYTSQ